MAKRWLPRKRGMGKRGAMRWIIPLSMLALVSCTLPGRKTLAPAPVPADVQSIAATQAFAGRIPLVSIAPDTQDFAGPVRDAVGQALAIKQEAEFEVRAVVPNTHGPDAAAAQLAALAPLAEAVAKSISNDGVLPGHVALTAGTGGTGTEILVYVK
jgi:hypothetical protein